MIQLPEGYGEVGRSVYQRMRELKTLHELAWGNGMLYDKATRRTLTRHERGRRLNDQKANTIADVAAVLAGVGKGNKMRPATILADDADEEVDAVAGRPGNTARLSDLEGGLLKATVFWANGLDQNFAQEWPVNVTHATFENSEWQPLEQEVLARLDEGQSEDGQESQKAPSDLVANEELRAGSEETRKPSP